MATVVYFSGETQVNFPKAIGKSFEADFRESGYDFIHADFSKPEKLMGLVSEIRNGKPIEFAFAFMNYGAAILDMQGGSENLWQKMGIPFLSLSGDSPAYYFDCNVCLTPNHARLYGFPEHETLRRRLPAISNGYIGRCRTLPLDRRELEELNFKAKAGGQLFFLKNGSDPKKLWDSWSMLDAKPLKALRELASYLAADLTNPVANQIDDIVTSYLQNCGFDISSMVKLRLFFIAQLDDYLRRVKSTMMAEALMDFPVQVRGANWGHLDFSGKRAVCVNDCDYATSVDLIRDGLGIIDMSPNTGLAPHDRACRAFGAYTLCITNEQEFFREELPHFDNICFRFDRDSLQGRIAQTLANPARYVDFGIEVAAAFRRTNSAEASVRHLAETAALIKLDQRHNPLPSSPNFFVGHPHPLPSPETLHYE